SEVGPLLYEADLVISAGGVTSLELAALGTPFLTLQIASNQKGNIAALMDNGVTFSLGEVSHLDSSLLVSQTKKLLEDFPKRQAISQKGQSLVDGRGLERILPLLFPQGG